MTFLKLALGSITTHVNVNLNRPTKEFITLAQNEIKNIFRVEENETIEIVEGGIEGRIFCEMGVKLPNTEDALINNITCPTAYFYARIVLKVGNVTYIKTNQGNDAVYFRKRDYLNDFQNTPMLTEAQMRQLTEPRIIVSRPETCGICYENEVQSIRIYTCSHLFCGTCISRWNGVCPICRSGTYASR